MGLINGIVLVILGGLCLPSIIAKKNPKAKELLDKIVPIQGTVGLFVFAWGIWGVITSLLSLGIISSWPISWITGLLSSVISFAGGAILGWGMIQKKILVKAPQDVLAKAEDFYVKLVKLQEKIGYAAIIMGIWTILYTLLLQNILKL